MYLNRQRENCVAISNLNCYFLSDAVDSLPPFDNLCVCCFSFCFASLFFFRPPTLCPLFAPPNHHHHHIPTPSSPPCRPRTVTVTLQKQRRGVIHRDSGNTAERILREERRPRAASASSALPMICMVASQRLPDGPASRLRFSPRGKQRRLVCARRASNQRTHCSANAPATKVSEAGGGGTSSAVTLICKQCERLAASM